MFEQFDRIVCLNLSDRKDRRNAAAFQLAGTGILNLPSFKWHFAVKYPFSDLIASKFNETQKGRFRFGNEFNCAREHFAIVKEAYDLDVQHLLVIEDDVLFMSDLKKVKEILDNVPEDWDLLQFGAFSGSQTTVEAQKANQWWMDSVNAWNCSMYALNRRGMKYYLACQNSYFTVADNPLYFASQNKSLVNAYLAVEPVVIQDKSLSSDIRSDEETVAQTSVNLYEAKVRKENYGFIAFDK